MQPPAEHKGGPSNRADRLPAVFGRYLLMQRLSRGGMGEIFLAKHGLAGFEKLAVIKKVLPNLAEDSQFISRFVDEAQVAIKLAHVNIAQVFEVGRVGDEYFLALEYVDGRDLRRTLSLLGQENRRFPVDMALLIGREMANGLAYAHRRVANDGSSLGLVHCDISPPNVMVSFEGETKIIDFGIARSALRGTATDPKMGFGKFGYMAPEQLIRGGVVDHRTDVYAAGVVLFELLTGHRLYEPKEFTDYRALARAVAQGQHRVPSDIDSSLAPCDSIITTALAPRPEERFATAAELRDSIQRLLAAINPTVSTDQLSAVMRGLFAKEMAQQRELQERIANTHLADFHEQLNTQAVPTVSFALNESSAELVPKGTADLTAAERPSRKAPANGQAAATPSRLPGSPGSSAGSSSRGASSSGASGSPGSSGASGKRAGRVHRTTGPSATVPSGGSARVHQPTSSAASAGVPVASSGGRSASTSMARHRAPVSESSSALQAQALKSHRSTMIVVAISAAVAVGAIVFVLIRNFFHDDPPARMTVQPIEDEPAPARPPRPR